MKLIAKNIYSTIIVILTVLCFINKPIAGQNLIAENFPPEAPEDKADEQPVDQIEFNSLSGDWWGVRTNLYKSGYEFNFSMKNDMFSSHSAYTNAADYLNMFTFNSSLNLDQLLGWNNTTFFAEVIGLHGTAPEDKIGPAQGISNITSPHQWRLYQFWIEKSFGDNSLSVLAGLFDLNSEFDVRSTTGVFINPSWGIGPDFSGSGLNGPSIFPSTSMAVRIDYRLSENISIKAGIFDAVPGNHNEDYITHVFKHQNNGFLVVGEVAYSSGVEEVQNGFGKYTLGSWYYTESYDDLTDVDEFGNPIKRFGNGGFYINAEKFVWAKPGFQDLGLSIFGRLGFANKDLNAVQTFWGFGFNFNGVFTDNPEEILGFAVANARFSSKYALLSSMDANNVKFNETIFELTYSFNMLVWLRLQPDFQYIINPSESLINHAFIAGLRIEFSF